MGYQLWTSPITGYRRRGTKLSDFSEAFGKKITVASIVEPLRSCPEDAPAGEMRVALKELEFDVAGVKPAKDGNVSGLVMASALKGGLVRDHMRQIPQESVVDSSLTLHELFGSLSKNVFVFVRVDERIDGIVTYADLNKPIVRMYFFGVISLLEIHLSFWIAQAYEGESWQKSVAQSRLDAAKAIQDERQARGQEIGLRDCLQFADKRDLVLKRDDLRDQFKLGSKAAGYRLLRKAEELRNALAHSQYDLTMGAEWKDLVALVQKIESTIDISDALVEEHSRRSASFDLGTLW